MALKGPLLKLDRELLARFAAHRVAKSVAELFDGVVPAWTIMPLETLKERHYVMTIHPQTSGVMGEPASYVATDKGRGVLESTMPRKPQTA